MRQESLDFLRNMLEKPSPSGYEQPVQEMWRTYTWAFADNVHTDVHGNSIGVINPQGTPRVLFAGHCDEIGFMVRYIDDKGFLYFGAIGGFDETIIPGRRVTIHTVNGSVPGVIGKAPIHLIKTEDRKKGAEITDLWIDICAKDKKEAESIVAIGDPVTYRYDFMQVRDDYYTARGFDDRIGSFIVAEILRELADSTALKASVYSVSTVQEEIGLRGAHTSAYGIDPQVGVATDVTFATDHPGLDQKHFGDIRLGSGPVIARGPNINPRVFDLLTETAKKNNIPYQVEGIPKSTGTDANAIQLTRAGVASGLVSVPARYMHTPVETLCLSDVEYTVKLMAAFAEAITPEMKFIP
ncbi:MAG: M42 family metallopeptidase [Candidatus Latescibacter sp.]|nr:M42 family metallopeptidase [Candidatus Latescibacter sp.]